MRESGLYSRAAILKSRYGTGSGSDLVASEAVARGGTRSLPLPVLSRAMIAERLPDLSDQKQRSANNNQSVSRRDPQGFGQSSAGAFNADYITMGRFGNRGRLGGARAGDSGNYDLVRGWKRTPPISPIALSAITPKMIVIGVERKCSSRKSRSASAPAALCAPSNNKGACDGAGRIISKRPGHSALFNPSTIADCGMSKPAIRSRSAMWIATTAFVI